MEHVSAEQLNAQLRELGVREGDVLLVHTSFRNVRPVEGGPLGLIDALRFAIGPQGTLVMPTMTDGESVFDPSSTPSADMGTVAETFWRQPGVLRSTHPGASFAAFGPRAQAICAAQPLAPPHGLDSPVGRVYELDGKVLLLGVRHSENTTIHLAENLAEVPYSVAHPCVIAKGETVMIPESDHCCENFVLVGQLLRERDLQREGTVGYARAMLMRSRDVVEVVREVLKADVLRFLCSAGCDECAAARASVRSVGA